MEYPTCLPQFFVWLKYLLSNTSAALMLEQNCQEVNNSQKWALFPLLSLHLNPQFSEKHVNFLDEEITSSLG